MKRVCNECGHKFDIDLNDFQMEWIPEDGDLRIQLVCPKCHEENHTFEVNVGFELNYK